MRVKAEEESENGEKRN